MSKSAARPTSPRGEVGLRSNPGEGVRAQDTTPGTPSPRPSPSRGEGEDRARGAMMAITPEAPLMRVIGAAARQRHRLAGVAAIRPTQDRLPSRCSTIMMHATATRSTARAVLDLFAGSGALASRDLARRAFVLFVDNGAEARALLAGTSSARLGGVTRSIAARTHLGPSIRLKAVRVAFLDRTTARLASGR